MNFNDFIGKRIRELRQEKGLSQEELAFEADIDRTYLSSIERGKRNISLAVALKIVTALKVSVLNLIEKDDGITIDGTDFSRRNKISKK